MNLERIKQIRDVFSYSKRYKHKIFVIYFDDALLQSHALYSLIQDITRLLESQIKVVLVPDIQSTVKRVFTQFGRSFSFLQKNDVVIQKEDVELLEGATFETIGKLLALFATYKQASVVGNWVGARTKGVVQNRDLLYAGIPEKIDTRLIHLLLQDSVIPIIPALGWSNKIQPYYLSAVELAAQISVRLGASKLIYFRDEESATLLNELKVKELQAENDTEYVDFSEQGSAVRMTLESAQKYLQHYSANIQYMFQQILSASVYALKHGVERVHFLDGNIEGALLIEVFFDQGIGFMVNADEYQAIGTISEQDIETVYAIMLPYMKNGVLVLRDIEAIRASFRDYVSYKVDGEIYGVAALHELDATSAEIASVAVQSRYDSFGVGKKIVEYLLKKAKQSQYSKVYCLTQTIGDWLEHMGFVQVSVEELPKKRLMQYRKMARNSRVYVYRF